MKSMKRLSIVKIMRPKYFKRKLSFDMENFRIQNVMEIFHIPCTSRTIRASIVTVMPGDKFPLTNSTIASIWSLHLERYVGRLFTISASSTCTKFDGRETKVSHFYCYCIKFQLSRTNFYHLKCWNSQRVHLTNAFTIKYLSVTLKSFELKTSYCLKLTNKENFKLKCWKKMQFFRLVAGLWTYLFCPGHTRNGLYDLTRPWRDPYISFRIPIVVVCCSQLVCHTLKHYQLNLSQPFLHQTL